MASNTQSTRPEMLAA